MIRLDAGREAVPAHYNEDLHLMKTIAYYAYGSPDVLRLVDVPKPVPGPGEVLVRVCATTVSVADVRARSFTVPRSAWLPARLTLGVLRPRKQILGAELAGVVEATGKGVTRFGEGDEVMAATLPRYGAYAEYVCLPQWGSIAIKPPDVSFAEAAALPVGARTALHYLKRAGVENGCRVLVYGASGSVGTYAVQLARHRGAEVTGVCSTRNLEMVCALGASRVVDYTRENVFDCSGCYDVVMDCVDKASFVDCAGALCEGGVYVNVTQPLPSARMLWARMRRGTRLILGENPRDSGDDLAFLAGLVGSGTIRAVIDHVYPLDQVVDAHRYVEEGHKRGNVVLHMGTASRVAASS